MIDRSVLVTEDEILRAMRLVLETEHWVVEGAAGVAMAAYLQDAERYRGKTGGGGDLRAESFGGGVAEIMLRAIALRLCAAAGRGRRRPSYHFAAVWDGAKVWKDACVTVGGRSYCERGGPCSGGAIDLTRYTAIPGMIDVHTHMTYVLENRVSAGGARRGGGVSGAGQRA